MFEKGQHIFMVGIEGSGMRALAFLLTQRGVLVSGSDQSVEQKKTIGEYEVMPENDAPGAFTGSDLLIYSDAVKADHPLRELAQNTHVPQLPYQEALGEFAKDFVVLAVTGTHGKSSTTAMAAHILVEAGLDPTVVIGASIPAWGGRNARAGKGTYLLVEADEYRRHFLALHPHHVVITSVDFDHPDYFTSLEDVEKAYGEFMGQCEGNVIVPQAVKNSHPSIPWSTKVIEIASDAGLDLKLTLPGGHMQQNAALAIALAQQVGVSHDDAMNYVQAFAGLKRRMEKVGEKDGALVFSDYGHHPQEIQVTLQGIRERYPDKKIGIFVEPHTPERLEAFFDGFVEALSGAYEVVICPVFHPKGREGKISDKPQELLEALHKQGVAAQLLVSFDQLPSRLEEVSGRVDIVVAFTAGLLDGKLRSIFHD
jgi:UDP-N-acetylmuramate--alanine ligase